MSTSVVRLSAQQVQQLDVFSRMMAQHMAMKNQIRQNEQPKDQKVSSQPVESSTPSTQPADVFPSFGSWEAHAAENNVRAAKKTRRKIRRLSECDSSDYSDRSPASLSPVELVPNPFCLANSMDCKTRPLKIKRVCFNPTITYHYF